MENKIRVLVVDDTSETRSNIKTLLEFEDNIEVVGEAENGEEAIDMVQEFMPDIILMDINMPVMDGIKATEFISMNVPGTSVIIMSVQGETGYLKKAMTAGARDYLNKPFSSEDLVKTINKTFEFERGRKKSIDPDIEDDENFKSKVVSIFSTKGGVGKSVIATNLAVALSKVTKKKIALVDLDLEFGNIAIMLNVSVKSTISDVVKDIAQVDKENINDFLVPHFSGIKILPAPVKPEYAEYITSMHIENILTMLKEQYHYIIIDTGVSFGEATLSALDMSDKIIYVSTLDIPTIKNIKAGYDVMKSLNYQKEKIEILINRASEQYGIKYADFENALKHEIRWYIPDDPNTIITSLNKGFPFVMKRTETKVADIIVEMAKEIADGTSKGKEEKKGIKKFFGL
jgi:pilus assembly protein CpaE